MTDRAQRSDKRGAFSSLCLFSLQCLLLNVIFPDARDVDSRVKTPKKRMGEFSFALLVSCGLCADATFQHARVRAPTQLSLLPLQRVSLLPPRLLPSFQVSSFFSCFFSLYISFI